MHTITFLGHRALSRNLQLIPDFILFCFVLEAYKIIQEFYFVSGINWLK